MVLTYIDTARIVRDAGFPNGNPQAMAVAIICAESGRKTDAVNVNEGGSAPGSRDLGLWQLNDYYHPVGEEVAFDPTLATEYAFKLSGGGTNFKAWYGFTNGGYLRFMEPAKVAIDAVARLNANAKTIAALRNMIDEQARTIRGQESDISNLKDVLDGKDTEIVNLTNQITTLSIERSTLAAKIQAALNALS